MTSSPKKQKSTWPQPGSDLKGLSMTGLPSQQTFLETMAYSTGNTSGSFERDVGALRGFSSERQESSLGNESGEKTKEEGVDNT